MGEFETLRRLALLLVYLKDELRTKEKRKLSDAELAIRLSKAQVGGSTPFELDGSRINAIVNGKIDISSDEEAKLIRAIYKVIRARNPRIASQILKNHLPKDIEERYARRLRQIFVQPTMSPLLQGEELGGTAELLRGIWQAFYISPTDRSGAFKAEIRGFAIVFRRAHASDRMVDTVLISGQDQFTGYSFKIGNHLYIICRDKKTTETAFFIANNPTTAHIQLIGISAALEREVHDKPHSIPPVIGMIFFGQKCASINNEIDAITNRILQGQDVAQNQLKKIQGRFCTTYGGMSRLQQEHPEFSQLYAYLEASRINGDEFSLRGLHLAWP